MLIVASNSTGGVMAKMIGAQSIVVAAVATEQSGQRRANPAIRAPRQHVHGVDRRVDDARAGLCDSLERSARLMSG